MKHLVYNKLAFSAILTSTILYGESALAIETGADSYRDTTSVHTLDEFVVTSLSARRRISQGSLGSENLELERLAQMPHLFGEADIIKSITLLPGVHSEGEGAGGFEVRGGNAYQNLVTMDGITLYNPAHLMGVFSTFNDDAMSSATLHKGPIPAEFGGASSSVLETYMLPGNMKKHNFSATVGLLNAKISANGPIVRDRLSYSIAARRSYLDMFLKLVPEYRKTIMNFYDINFKLRFRASDSDMIDFSFFNARDHLELKDLMGMKWGNIAGGLNWTRRSGEGWTFQTSATATSYNTYMDMSLMDQNQDIRQFIRSTALNERVYCSLGDSHDLGFGLRSEYLHVKSGDLYSGTNRELEIRSGWENAVWTSYDGRFSDLFSLSAAIRLSAYSALSQSRFHKFESSMDAEPDRSAKTWFSPEPRVSVRFDINDCHNIKGGFSMTSQNIHGISSNTTTFPFDRYALSSAAIRPERATQYSLGYSGMTENGVFDWSAEVYYKSLRDVYDYRDGCGLFSGINLDEQIMRGKGRSYGIELMVRKNLGKLSGWISYSLSWTDTRIPGINDGKWYDASNDRRHYVAVVGQYEFNHKWRIAGSWTFSSGRPLTAPDAKYDLAGKVCYYYSQRNGYKTPPAHRLDLSATYTHVGKHVTSMVNFGFYNAYAYQSPFVIYFEDDPSKPSGTRAVQQSLFGLVPSVSYTIIF